MSTNTPLSFYSLPDKGQLQKAFVGKPLSALRTPALIVDRKVFKENCERVTGEANARGMAFRAHVKTHKTTEGTRMQVEAAGGVKAVIASTMVEVWQVVQSGLVEEGLVDDILYSMPIGADKLEDITSAQDAMAGKGVIRIMVDHAQQIQFLQAYNKRLASEGKERGKWSVFVKVDGGGRRAGAPPESEQMKDLLAAILAAPEAISIFGFYSHFGQSYASSSLAAGSSFFHAEIACTQTAAKLARSLGAQGDWVISVGATPTAHAAVQEAVTDLKVDGKLELHAGCYCMNDLQQLSTSLPSPSHLALSVLSRVVSLYPAEDRREAMCDTGALAVSKDTGRQPGYGRVIWPKKAEGWDLGRVSQEHGTLVRREGGGGGEGELEIGDLIRILPQHACLVCACFPWMYVVDDGGEEVVDVWVPWKGW
ncbi:hypothetical protein B9479_007291 [Cryptococcus floricola]|uniref:D-serine dehydratase n=1 Tax=Cryptococcus floricola TaxID=2591691 RepID=A0A5D3APP2_9TREE|nr:hypothetical protein B9479_007291 [Cryptococcus floricola]